MLPAPTDFSVERSVALSTAITVEPCTVAELKDHLRVTSSADDTYLTALISAVREQIELEADRAITPQTLVYRRRGFPLSRDFFELPRSPVRAVSSITYINDDTGSADTLATTVYALDATQLPARVYLKHDQSWPGNVRDITASVVVTYTAGPADAASVLQLHKIAVYWLAAWWYENRLPTNIGNIVNRLPDHLQNVIWGQKIFLAHP